MVITPTQSLTQTVALWVDAQGTDVGSWVTTIMPGLQVLMFLAVMALGLWLSLRVMP